MNFEAKCRDCGALSHFEGSTIEPMIRCEECGGVMDPTPDGIEAIDTLRHAAGPQQLKRHRRRDKTEPEGG